LNIQLVGNPYANCAIPAIMEIHYCIELRDIVRDSRASDLIALFCALPGYMMGHTFVLLLETYRAQTFSALVTLSISRYNLALISDFTILRIRLICKPWHVP
jgi:hypothetical protein